MYKSYKASFFQFALDITKNLKNSHLVYADIYKDVLMSVISFNRIGKGSDAIGKPCKVRLVHYQYVLKMMVNSFEAIDLKIPVILTVIKIYM